MKNNINIEDIYIDAKMQYEHIIYTKTQTENDLLNIINKLKFDTNFKIIKENNYNFTEISNLFRFYEDELKSSFLENKQLFESKFKCYILLIKLFTELCIIFSVKIEKRPYINNFFQLLKESKNMLKFFIPLHDNHLKILNNLIGEQLYYFTHIQYISTKDKSLDYIFEEYYLNLEKQLHGYELSLSTNFGENELSSKSIEYMIFINNASFLLLKMIHKLSFYRPKETFIENKYFMNIFSLFNKISNNKNISNITHIKEFEEILIKSFNNSSNYLKTNKNHDMIKEKVELLQLNTDEYKQLIVIILSLKD